MKKIISIIILTFGLSVFAQNIPKVMKTEFPVAALQDEGMTINGNSESIEKALSHYKGKIVLLDLWATWCGDCITNLPSLKSLHHNNPDVVFVYLSMDKSVEAWKNGIEKYQIEGEHFYMGNNWKGNFGTGIDLNWIPRYLVLDQKGKIAHYYSVKADDPKVQEAINQLRNKKSL